MSIPFVVAIVSLVEKDSGAYSSVLCSFSDSFVRTPIKHGSKARSKRRSRKIILDSAKESLEAAQRMYGMFVFFICFESFVSFVLCFESVFDYCFVYGVGG